MEINRYGVKKVRIMAEIDPEVVLVKLRLIAKYRNNLEECRSVPLDEYLADFRQQLIVEKYADAFVEAGRQGIITSELAAELVPSAGMRNILVNQYKDIDS